MNTLDSMIGVSHQDLYINWSFNSIYSQIFQAQESKLTFSCMAVTSFTANGEKRAPSVSNTHLLKAEEQTSQWIWLGAVFLLT